jgi:dipeptidyl aminopeptidase/acylaminoacyl peptidase
MKNRFVTVAIAGAVCVSMSAVAQQAYTAKDYANAERWMSYNVSSLVKHTVGGVTYLADGRVFFRDPGAGGTAYMIADPAKGTVTPAFDNVKLAEALNDALGAAAKPKLMAARLNVTGYEPEAAGGFAVTVQGAKFHCNAMTKCVQEPPPPPPQSATPGQQVATRPAAPAGRRRRGESGNESPDKKLAAFIRDNNLWVREIATGKEWALTTDGAKDFGYATDNAGWQHSDAAVVTWSADGKKVATFQLDERKTGLMYLVPVTNRHPTLEAWHYPLVGDKDVTMIEPVVIDVAAAQVTRLKTPPLEHRSMECDDVSCEGGRWSDAEFSPDNKQLAFVATSRDHKDEWVKVADIATGEVREVYHEHVPTYYGWQSRTDWKVLWGANEFLWVSERSGWAQIYRYDLATGKLKGEVTHGDGPVTEIPLVDEKHGVVYFTAVDKEKGEEPYYQNLYRVGLDGKDQRLLTPEIATHTVTMGKDGSTFVDTYSKIDVPQTALLRDNNGKVLLTLAKQDASALLVTGWKPPMEVTVKARDGKTPLYGFLWKPTNFDATKKYPVIDNVYPGPQGSLCQLLGRGFSASKGDEQAMADLGFVVVCIDGMGNPERSKEFHDAHASTPQEMGDDTIPDQVSGIKDLGTQFPWVDATRVGIWGHSGGGNATASAMFHFPEFFKVGWAESGNHDQREYEDDWDERWAGLEVVAPDGKSNYDEQANQNYAKNLMGHLMLVHGTMDDNVPPNNTLLVVDALMKANKSFDMLMVPNVHHGYAEMSQYITRRRWDYFVTWLAGGVPPENYQMKSAAEIQRAMMADGPNADADNDGDPDY